MKTLVYILLIITLKLSLSQDCGIGTACSVNQLFLLIIFRVIAVQVLLILVLHLLLAKSVILNVLQSKYVA